jgi:hypothetical protein
MWCNALEIRGEENWLDDSLLNMYIYGGHTLFAKGPNALERTSFAHYEPRAYTNICSFISWHTEVICLTLMVMVIELSYILHSQ